ncbi:hypothetical protein EJ110_NYTH15271 [Nymphaea thermarum]|nr:hypothetical protein EJ110_NYTH15271 [Nymphaea thermarum]
MTSGNRRPRPTVHDSQVNMDRDPTWQWCVRVKKNNRLRLKCNFCGNTLSGGISRMKHHLAGTSKDAAACVGGPNKPLPPFVRQQCLDMLHALHQKRIQKEIEEAEVGYNVPLEDEEEEEEAYECEEEPATIFDDEDLECFNLEDEATEGFVDEGESATAACWC